MHTQTIYELSQEAERLLMLSLEHLRQLQKLPMTSLDDQRAWHGCPASNAQ